MQKEIVEHPARSSGEQRRVSPTMLNQLHEWLMEQALDDADIEPIVYGCCERLQALGVPLMRGYFVFPVLHPLHSAIGLTWMRGKGTTVSDYPHVPGGINARFRASPHFYMLERHLASMRIRLDDETPHYAFPILDDLRADGATDYLAFLLGGDRSIMMGSWTTNHSLGFSHDDIATLLTIERSLAVATKMAIKSQLMRNIGKTYLGRSAGRRVLGGKIRRGDGDTIEAAIWYADMRNSTMLADRLDRQAHIALLNTFFDTTAGAVVEEGGEVLSFIGDAVLAIFPTGEGAFPVDEACRRALQAASGSRSRLFELNAQRTRDGLEPLDFGVGLHFGEVTYGNVGIPARLTFSVFGAAVNEVARLDQLTKQLEEPVLVSETFARRLEQDWRALGKHALRGVGRRMKVYAPAWSPVRPRSEATASV